MTVSMLLFIISSIFLIVSILFWVRPLTLLKLKRQKIVFLQKFEDIYFMEDEWYDKQAESSALSRDSLMYEFDNISLCTMVGQLDACIRRALIERGAFQDDALLYLRENNHTITNFFSLRSNIINIDVALKKIELCDDYLSSLFDQFEELKVDLYRFQIEDIELEEDDIVFH